MAITAAQIDEYFKQLDWPFTKREDTLWDSGYAGQNYRVRFTVRLTERWIYVNALVPSKIKPESRANVFEHLLRLNYQMNSAKFYLDNDDDVTLADEIPALDLQVSEFEAALYSVCTNADQHFVEIMYMAQNPNAVSSLKPKPAEAIPPTDGGSSGASGDNSAGGGVDWSGGDNSGTPPTTPPAS